MKIMIIIAISTLLIGIFRFVQKQQGNTDNQSLSIHLINKEQLLKTLEMNNTIQFVDVRTPSEYKSRHIKPAVNINYMSGDFTEKFNTFNKEQPLYLYCKSGNRSRKAAQLLAQEGFTEIYDLKGGIMAWD